MRLHQVQILLIILIVCIGGWFAYLKANNLSISEVFMPTANIVRIGDVNARVLVADSDEERKKGLSGLTELKNADAMLFIFPEADYHGIWMKDMRFPIDIIWVSEDYRIINIERNVSPDTYPRSFRPDRPAKYVLETEVDYSEALGIRPGQFIKLPERYIEN